MWRKKYYQHLPLLLGAAGIVAVITIFLVASESSFMTEKEIIDSSTMKAISGEPLRQTLLISVGVLIPFIFDQVYAWLNGMNTTGVETYLLPTLILIMQFFNIYTVSQGQTIAHYWTFHMGIRINVIAVCSVIFAVQISLVRHSIEVIYVIAVSTVLFDLSIVIKVLGFLLKSSILGYVWVGLWVACILTNIYIAYAWYKQYIAAKKSGLPHLEYFYAFTMIVMLIFFLSANLICSLTGFAFALESMNSTGVVTQQLILMCCFYGITEINSLVKKHQAQSSMVSILFFSLISLFFYLVNTL